MAKGKYLILCLILPIKSFANPWLPKEGQSKYIAEFSNYNINNYFVEIERRAYIDIETKIALLSKQISIIKHNTRIAASNNQVTAADNPLVNNFLDHRIREVNENIANLRLVQQNLILNPKLWHSSTIIEYGASEDYSYGITGNLSKCKYSNNNSRIDDFGLFFKYKLYQNKHNIFTLQPKFFLSGDRKAINITAMLGNSSKRKSKIGNFDLDIFRYLIAGVTKYFNPTNGLQQIQYNSEITSGVKFEDSLIFMLKAMHELNPRSRKIYNSVLRREILVAKNIGNKSDLYLSFGYFSLNSLSARRNIANGYSAGLWIEI